MPTIGISLLLLFLSYGGFCQTIGGTAAYPFLRLPASPLQSASGGINLSYPSGEVSGTPANPALLKKEMSGQVHVGFHSLLSGTKGYQLTGAYHVAPLQLTLGSHLHFIDYGSLPNTDAAGNVLGAFRPVDVSAQFSVSGMYLERWSYGIALKYINSSYGVYRSSAIASDVGLLYHDTAHLFSAALVVKNMGTQLTAFAGQGEDLPFDLQVGFTKQLNKAPFAFSVSAQHLHRLDILYNDTAFNRSNNTQSATSVFSKLVTHLILTSHVYLGSNLEATLGYNFLRRRDLNVGQDGNGLTGFSGGLQIRFSKFRIFYARAAYQRGVSTNQIGVTLNLKQFLKTEL